MEEQLLTAEEVAHRLKVSVSWVYAHTKGARPEIAAVRMGGLIRFREKDVEEFIQQCLSTAKKRGLVA